VTMSLGKFAMRFVRLGREQPLRFDGRPYLKAIYGCYPRSVVLRCSRQVEKSTYLANSILYELAMFPGIRILYVAPRAEQSRLFARLRILRAIEESPLLRRRLLGERSTKQRLNDMSFTNGSLLHFRSAYSSADSARGLSIDSLYVDEYQDMAHGHLPVLEEAMSHSTRPRTVLAGTPKLIENHLEEAYLHSSRNEWRIPCKHCGAEHLPTAEILVGAALRCPACHNALDPQSGYWKTLNPLAERAGFWVNHFMAPWLDAADIAVRRKEYDDVRFKNEVLGLPTFLGDHVVTIAELQACCTRFRMPRGAADLRPDLRHSLVAGIDWSGGAKTQSAICVGYLDASRIFQVVHLATFRPKEDPLAVVNQLVDICRRFGVISIAADSGMGQLNNRMVLSDLTPRHPFTTISYVATTSTPTADPPYHRWSVSKLQSIGHLLGRVKLRQITFPDFSESGPFLEDFASELAIYNDELRTITFKCPDNAHDDVLHACNYALLQACRLYEAGLSQYSLPYE
jgi:hypothetical protein